MDEDVPTNRILKRRMESDDPAERDRFDAELLPLGADARFEYLQNVLWDEGERRTMRGMRVWLVAQVAIPALLFVALAGGWPIPIPVAFLLSLLGPPALAGNLEGGRATRRERFALERMAAGGDVRALYHLVTARFRLRSDEPLRASVEEALVRLLPRLTPETAHVMDSQFDHVWQGIADAVLRAARGRSRESAGMNRAMLRALGNARPAAARAALTEVANATSETAEKSEAEALRAMAASYLAAWDAEPPVADGATRHAAPSAAETLGAVGQVR